jgi:uncharacterized protein YndB with AHSA1/START domain
VSAQTVIVRRRLPATCEEVFEAWLDAAGMRRWMCPGPVTSCEVTMETRVGGRFCILMRGPGMEVVNTGAFRVLDRPSKLVFTWVSSRWEEQETLVTIELQPHGEECELVLTHERFPAGHSTTELAGGWGQILEKLDGALARRGERHS